MIAGTLNICACFFPLFVSASATLPPSNFGPDPFPGGGDMYPGGPPGMDDMGMDPMMGGPPGGMGPPPAGPPDPYADPYGESGAGKGDGVGAGSAPPGAIDRRRDGDDDEEDEGKMVYDPRTGLWSTRGKGVPANPIVGGMMGMPMGYNMYGGPMMNPFMGNTVPTKEGGEFRSSKDIKKAIKKQARKELKRMKRKEEEEEESGSETEDEDDRSSRRAARRRWKEAARRAREVEHERERAFERQIREEEKRRQMIARGIAMQDARQRAIQEVAEEDARMRNYQDMIDNQREMAMTDAQRLAFQTELDEMREQQQLLLARRRAEMDAAERERQDDILYRQQQPNQPHHYYSPSYQPNEHATAQYYQGQPQQHAQRRMSQTPSLPAYQPAYGGSSGQGGQAATKTPLKLPGQPSAPPSYAGSGRYLQPPNQVYPPQAWHQQQYPYHQQLHYPSQAIQEELEYDSDDDITEIQSVRSETSSQRRLIRQRMEEERERVLMTQSLEQQYKAYGAPAYDEMDIVDDYRSGRSIDSSQRSGSRRPERRA